ncbi:MAG: biotin transporter BioY [Spirulinaceae cyanobacterium SM2_1_0]|nr:biotin transporter BioY [Spirulinaceae cyanobacterium SM2_1_0]
MRPYLVNTQPPPSRRSRRTRRPQSARRPPATRSPSVPYKLSWALIGLFLTIGGTFVVAFITNLPWKWAEEGIQVYSLNVNYQIAAVLLVACLGGPLAGSLAQLAYIAVGLSGLQVFYLGGGINYVQEPAFGYLLGFIPGAWLCGLLAFKRDVQLESLAYSCLCGLLAIHVTGILYLIGLHLFSAIGGGWAALWSDFLNLSVHILPGQLAIVCAVSVLAYILRRLMFY